MTERTDGSGQYEVELKIQADHDAVRTRLEELDATHDGTAHQTDTYYKSPFEDLLDDEEALRVRRQRPIEDDTDEDENILIYKGPLMDTESKTREELEAVVTDSNAMIAILEKMGFEQATVIDKEREFYSLDGYTVSLDSVVGLGQFIEIEMITDDIENARDGALELLEKLGLNPEEQIRNSYVDLKLKDYL